MKAIELIESDLETANKCLTVAIASLIIFGLVTFFLYRENNLSPYVFLIPLAAFLFNFGLYVFYKNRNSTNYLSVNQHVFLYEINGEKKSFLIADITKIEVEKFWGSERSNFVFYICTDSCRERIPRFESVTDIKIAKTLIFMNPKIDAVDAKKVFSF